MPDLDKLPRGVRKGWARVATAVQGAQPAEVVADEVEKALAKSIRLCKDLGWLDGLDQAVRECHRLDSMNPLDVFVDSLDQSVTKGVESSFVDVARQMAVSREMSDVLGGAGVLVPGLLRMVDKLCIGPLGPNLVPTVFSDHVTLDRYVAAVRNATNAEGIAEQVLRQDYNTARVRAPRTRLERPGTRELLHVEIV